MTPRTGIPSTGLENTKKEARLNFLLKPEKHANQIDS